MLLSCRINSEEEEINKNNAVSFAVPKYAVLVENVEYCHLRSKEKVLNRLSMSVPQGSIYGLTGSSGCGKTTLISCILGTRSVDFGDIFLNGCNNTHPNRKNILDIPGKGVGFMPQELSLYSKFTIYEILLYFGRLYGMTSFEVTRAAQTLLDLLQLSRRSAQIEHLSGGEQRRVSFAISLIHSPKLLVLDEPTVGMDPLLRLRIWGYLRSLVEERQVTVIITSHYLDEMRKADKIGIMRNGKIISEDSPEAMLSSYGVETLDEVVLKLCKNDECNTAENWVTPENKYDYRDPGSFYIHEGYKVHLSNLRESFLRTQAVVGKNIYLLLRNIPLFVFVICIPAIQLLNDLWIGYEPSRLPFGFVNKELGLSASSHLGNDSFHNNQTCPEFSADSLNSCELYLLSCRYLAHISTEKISLINFGSENDAVQAVHKGDIYGLVERALSQNENGTIDENILNQSQIIAHFDQSNTIIYRLLLKELYKAQEDFLTSLMSACGANRKLAEYPLQYQAAIFGVADDYSFSNYVSPRAAIPFMFFFSIISSGLRFVEERNSGMLERTLISGVKLIEIMTSFLISEFFLIVVQSSLIFGLLSWWVPAYRFESFAAIFSLLLMILAGYTGVSTGFLLGSLCSEQVQVAMIAIACTLPNIILSGIIWPLEAMPKIARTMVEFLPCTLSSEAVSSIWTRGLDITHPNVWPGVVVLLGYIVILNLLTIIYHANAKK